MFLYTHRYTHRAAEQLQSVRPLVIAVTGRIGKSTTAAFIAHLLSPMLPVLSVTGTRETIEHSIAAELLPTHRILIVEFQQQPLNEIRALCDLTKPIIGIVTNAHGEGILELTEHVVSSLPSSGLAILNHDDAQCQQLAQRTGAAVRFFSTKDHAHAYAQSIVTRPQEVHFSLQVRGAHAQMSVQMHGQHLLSPFLAACVVAEACGLTPLHIKERMDETPILPQGLQMRHGKNHAVILFGSPSRYPETTTARLEYLRLFESKRRMLILTRRVSESAYSRHQLLLLGKLATESADCVLMTGQSRKFRKTFFAGARSGENQHAQQMLHARPGTLVRSHLSSITPYDIVLVDGVPHSRIMRELLHT